MKKLLFISIILLTWSACGKNDEIDLPITKSIDISINVGEICSLTGSEFEILSNDNDFIASITETGIVKGEHQGITNAVVKAGITTYECKIAVAANTTLYIDMKYLLGMTKDQILSLYGTPYNININTYYFNGLLLEKRNLFVFDNDKVIICTLVFDSSYSSLITKHLNDRYKYYATSGGMQMYGDAYNIKDADIVALKEQNGNEIGITYTHYSQVQ